MAASPNGNDHQKAVALFACLFLVYVYKQMIWDPYFNPQRHLPPQEQVATTQTPQEDGKPNPSRFAEPTAPAFQQTSPSAVQTGVVQTPAQQAQPAGQVVAQAQYPSDAQIAAGGSVLIETDTLRARVSLLGGRVTQLELKDYLAALDKTGKLMNMVDHVEFAPYPLGIYSGPTSDAAVAYQLQSGQQVSTAVDQPNKIAAGTDGTVTLQGQLPDGRQVTKTLTFQGKGYFIDVSAKLSQPPPDASRLSLEWTQLIAKGSASMLDPYKISGFVWFDGQKALRESFAKLESNDALLNDIQWVTMADKYFMATLISEDGLVPARTMKTDELYRARLYGTDTAKHARLFAGPKSLRLLEEVGLDLKRNIDFGRTSIIAAPLQSLLHILHDTLGNYGLAIVMLTIIVKLALYPLTASSFKQMKAMQDLAPEMKRIKESGKDKQQQQLETMALYREKGVNPLGGCFPILVQMPVFIGLYSALLPDIELRHAPFALWIHDLSAPESLMILGFSVPVMVLLFIASMLIQQWTTPSSVDPAQKKAMLIVPLVFGFMFAKMPAGLTLYWLTNNLISIGQQAGFRGKKAAEDTPGKGKAISPFVLTAMIAGSVFVFAWLMTKIG